MTWAWVMAMAMAMAMAAGGTAAAAPVLMISVDGLRPLDVLEAQERGINVPNLRAMVQNGAAANGVIAALPTVTYPNHTTLITGVSPALHGISANVVFDPQRKNQSGWYWYEEAIRVPTLWDSVRAKRGITANIGWPVSVGARAIAYNIPEFWRARTPDDLLLLRAVSTPGLVDSLEKGSGTKLAQLSAEGEEGDEARVDLAIALLKSKKPDFMTLHLVSLDHEEHGFGPGAPEARGVLEKLDAAIGRLVREGRKAMPNLVVAVVSDHGFAPIDRQINLPAAFVQAGLITRDDKDNVTAWEANVWISGGSAQIILARPDDAALQAKVRWLLDGLAQNPENGIDRVIEREEIAKFGGNRDASFWVNAKPGFTMGGAMSGPLISPSGGKGMHGYFPDDPAMYASFIVSGAGVPKGKSLGIIDMRAIAPTLAKLAGTKLESTEVKPLF